MENEEGGNKKMVQKENQDGKECEVKCKEFSSSSPPTVFFSFFLPSVIKPSATDQKLLTYLLKRKRYYFRSFLLHSFFFIFSFLSFHPSSIFSSSYPLPPTRTSFPPQSISPRSFSFCCYFNVFRKRRKGRIDTSKKCSQ